MGVSNEFHFKWLSESVAPVRERIRASLPRNPHVIGIGEQAANPFIRSLLHSIDFTYQACDLFPRNAGTIACDMNDLSPLYDKKKADVVCLLRASYFIKDKRRFFEELDQITKPQFWFFTDVLIGSSDLPVLDFRYGDEQAAYAYDENQPAYFKTSFYDERLITDFPAEVKAFVAHARTWPLRTKIAYLLDQPKVFLRDVLGLSRLTVDTLGDTMKKMLPEGNLISLADFEQAGYQVELFNAKYFYPDVAKFNLYCFIGARRGNG
jgi:hypothetical protein